MSMPEPGVGWPDCGLSVPSGPVLSVVVFRVSPHHDRPAAPLPGLLLPLPLHREPGLLQVGRRPSREESDLSLDVSSPSCPLGLAESCTCPTVLTASLSTTARQSVRANRSVSLTVRNILSIGELSWRRCYNQFKPV